MDHFNNLLENHSDYKPVSTWRIQLPQTIHLVPPNKKHIQILYSSNHWVCSYYDTKYIFIYDLLYSNNLDENHLIMLTRLFPTYDFQKKNSIIFPLVQKQPNSNDCGVFAIAFAVSLLFNIKPEKVKYDWSKMRLHLIQIFESNVIEHFPQDLQCHVIQKVLPLAVVRAKELDATKKRIKRQYEKKHLQKLNNINKNKQCQQEDNVHNNDQVNYAQNLKRCAIKRCQNHEDEKNKGAEKRRKCEEESVNNIVKQRKPCEHNKRKNKRAKQKEDCENSNEKKLVKLHSERKWFYNKQYFQKKKKYTVAVEKSNPVKNIFHKYAKFRSTNYLRTHNSFEKYVIHILYKQGITNSNKSYIEKRLKAEQIVRWCFNIRDTFVRDMYKILAKLKNRSETCLSVAAECITVDDKISAFCGISRHTASSENYFVDSTYCDINSSKVNVTEPLMLNTRGQIVNMLTLVEARAKKSWLCGTLCKVNDPLLIERYQKLLEAINECTLRKIPELMSRIHDCTVTILDKNKEKAKKGHAHSCYINLNLCKAMFIPVQLLSPHFPKVRYIRRLLYQLYSSY